VHHSLRSGIRKFPCRDTNDLLELSVVDQQTVLRYFFSVKTVSSVALFAPEGIGTGTDIGRGDAGTKLFDEFFPLEEEPFIEFCRGDPAGLKPLNAGFNMIAEICVEALLRGETRKLL